MTTTRLGDGSTIRWMADEVVASVREQMDLRLVKAGTFLKNMTQHNVGTPGWVGGAKRSLRDAGGNFTSMEDAYWRFVASGDYVPSEPGQFPHMYLGNLKKSIFRGKAEGPKKDRFIRVGTKLPYGIDHELGARPFLRRTLQEERRRLTRIMDGRDSGTVFGEGGPLQQVTNDEGETEVVRS